MLYSATVASVIPRCCETRAHGSPFQLISPITSVAVLAERDQYTSFVVRCTARLNTHTPAAAKRGYLMRLSGRQIKHDHRFTVLVRRRIDPLPAVPDCCL